MKHLLYLAFAGAMLHAQVTIVDTIKTPMGGNWSGTVQVTLNNPATAQPLYSGSETLSGWSQTVTVTNGAFSITLYANDAITPTGTSYTARYTPTSGSAWSETWVCPTGATTIRELRSTTVPTPRTMFTPSQITQAGAVLNNVLRWNGSNWAPFASILTDPMTTTGDLIYRTGGVPARLPIGSTGQVLTVTGGAPAWAGLASTGLTDSAGLVRGAAAVAAGGVPYATAAGVLATDAGFSYDASKRELSLDYPVIFSDNFSGPAGAALNGRTPQVGIGWTSSGDGFASAYAGNGVMGVSSNQNTYFIAQAASTPYEITTTIRSTSGAPGTTISIVKDNTTWGFGVMWHVVYSGTGINHLYWNLIANGGPANVTSAAPVSQINSAIAPTLAENTDYVCRLTINGAYSDASIETTDGVVLYRSRAYEPLLPNLVGPWAYVQAGVTSLTFSSFRMTARPPKPSFDYGRFVSGIDGTPIGSLAPSPGFFSSLTVGGSKQGAMFQVNYSGSAALAPRVVGNNSVGLFVIESDSAGFASRLEIKNGFGGTGTIQMDGAFAFSLSGNNGTPFLIKPANSSAPYFASYLGFTSNNDTFLDRLSAGVIRISTNGTTGGGLVIEALKSTSGTRYVCVDTTGRITSSATACSGT